MPLVWKAPPRVIAEGVDRYSDELIAGLGILGQEEAALITVEMRANAPWHDRTGRAREGLKALAQLTGYSVAITAGYDVDYGVFLELGTSKMAPLPIVVPTLERHHAPVMAKARRLIGGGG